MPRRDKPEETIEEPIAPDEVRVIDGKVEIGYNLMMKMWDEMERFWLQYSTISPRIDVGDILDIVQKAQTVVTNVNKEVVHQAQEEENLSKLLLTILGKLLTRPDLIELILKALRGG
jgi:hypothetical protein